MSARKSIPASATHNAGFPPAPPATHQEAGDVSEAIAAGNTDTLGHTPLAFLPLFARVAIERVSLDEQLRTGARLDELLQAYADSMGRLVDLETCASAHRICEMRLATFRASVVGASWAACH